MVTWFSLNDRLKVILKQIDQAEQEFKGEKTLKGTARIFTVLILSIFVVATLMISIWLVFSKLGIFMRVVGGTLVIILLGIIVQFALVCNNSLKKCCVA